MILYFSGTGNSEYAARSKSAQRHKDKLMNLGERIRSRDFSGIHSHTPWVVAAPTYAWRIPRVLEEWLKNTELRGNKNIYFVMTLRRKHRKRRQIPEKAGPVKRVWTTGAAPRLSCQKTTLPCSQPPPGKKQPG